ncbi:type II secretion system protein GspL [Comamonas composti]|uniref:type II secretion system protein GspL n=1 Tax=Comamonas composti TaxID=408558 RepID=UPI000412F151|nr:type II secretion system protein GspL [Comamonas composti]
MSTLILYLPAQAGGDYAYALSSDGLNVDRHGHASAALLPAAGRAGQIVAVLPHQALSWHLVTLPQGLSLSSRRHQPKLRAVLEGLLEERLLDEPVHLHLALQPGARAGQPCWVAACDKPWLLQHLKALEAEGHSVGRIVPACAPSAQAQLWAMGSPESAWLLATGLGGRESLACLPLNTGHAEHTAPLATQALLQDLPPETPLLADPALAASAETLNHPVSLQTEAQRGLAAAAQAWDLAQFDLDLGGQSRALRRLLEGWQSFWRTPQWRAARWGAVLALLTQVIGLNAWAWKENRAIAAKQQQVRATLSSSFPQIPVIVDAPLQMQRELALLRQSSGALATDDLEPMLTAAAQALPAGQVAQSLDYQERKLRLQLANLPPEALEQARERLAGSGYRLDSEGSDWLLSAESRP